MAAACIDLVEVGQIVIIHVYGITRQSIVLVLAEDLIRRLHLCRSVPKVRVYYRQWKKRERIASHRFYLL